MHLNQSNLKPLRLLSVIFFIYFQIDCETISMIYTYIIQKFTEV